MNEFYKKDKVVLSVCEETSFLIDKLMQSVAATENYELKRLMLSSSVQCLHQAIDSVYAIDVANALGKFTEVELREFYKKIDHLHMARILEQSDEVLQKNIVTMLSAQDVLSLFHYMSNDDITDILGEVSIAVQKELLGAFHANEKETIQRLLQYDEDTVGSIMTTEYIAIKEGLTVFDALHKIKEIAPKTEVIEVIFVVNEKNNWLVLPI